MRAARGLISAIILSLTPPSPAATFDYDRYKPFTINAVARNFSSEGAKRSFDMGRLSYRFSVTFAGSVQPIRPRVREFINQWFKAAPHFDPSVPAMFQREILVREGSAEYWLPTQEALIQPLLAECPPGAPIDVYAVWLGADRDDLVFTVNEFSCEPPQPAG